MQPFQQFNISVGTTPKMILAFKPAELSSLAIKANGSLFLGVGGVSITGGFPMATNDVWSINNTDLSDAVKSENSLIQIYAVATFPTTVSIMLIRSC